MRLNRTALREPGFLVQPCSATVLDYSRVERITTCQLRRSTLTPKQEALVTGRTLPPLANFSHRIDCPMSQCAGASRGAWGGVHSAFPSLGPREALSPATQPSRGVQGLWRVFIKELRTAQHWASHTPALSISEDPGGKCPPTLPQQSSTGSH